MGNNKNQYKNVLRISLFDSDKKAIFVNPMLLITNCFVDSLATAIEIYRSDEPSWLFDAFQD
jgi:hypothetical protein